MLAKVSHLITEDNTCYTHTHHLLAFKMHYKVRRRHAQQTAAVKLMPSCFQGNLIGSRLLHDVRQHMLVEVLTVFFLRQVYLILLVPLLAAVKDVDISREIIRIYIKSSLLSLPIRGGKNVTKEIRSRV